MRILWHATARNDLVALRRYIADDDPQAAAEVAARIRGAVRSLSIHPYLGRSGRVADTRELVITNTPYLVAYAVDGDDVLILAVIHGARRWPERFPGR